MTPEEMAAIRERDAEYNELFPVATGSYAALDRHALLAHIDAITEAVEGLPWYSDTLLANGTTAMWTDRAAVLALLRGTPQE